MSVETFVFLGKFGITCFGFYLAYRYGKMSGEKEASIAFSQFMEWFINKARSKMSHDATQEMLLAFDKVHAESGGVYQHKK